MFKKDGKEGAMAGPAAVEAAKELYNELECALASLSGEEAAGQQEASAADAFKQESGGDHLSNTTCLTQGFFKSDE